MCVYVYIYLEYFGLGGDSSLKVKGITKDPEKGKDKDEENTEVVDIGFVPSFLEPGRQMRQKRYLICIGIVKITSVLK
jgi:hypothetical protein